MPSQRLGAIKELGVRIAIDDFGSDESLTYLKEISVDMLKFDRSFTSGIVESADRAAMMHTLIQVGKSLGLESQAKGIEEQDQFLHLQREGCDTGQGFLFARSLDVDAVGTLLDTWGIKAVAARTPAAAGPVTVLPGFN